MSIAQLEQTLDAATSLRDALRAIRAAAGAGRASIGVIDPASRSFEIVAADGESLLGTGTQLPLVTSSHFTFAARGVAFVSGDFERTPGFDRPVDRLIRIHGFRSGAAVPLETPEGLGGALSLHFREPEAPALESLPDLAPFLERFSAEHLGAPRIAPLTPREYEVLVSLEEGLRIKQIALALGISQATVKAHARSLFRKLGATSRAEATLTARRRGILHT